MKPFMALIIEAPLSAFVSCRKQTSQRVIPPSAVKTAYVP